MTYFAKTNPYTQKVRVKVCNHLFTLNFYITSSSRFLSHQFHIMKASIFILRVSELLEGGKV